MQWQCFELPLLFMRFNIQLVYNTRVVFGIRHFEAKQFIGLFRNVVHLAELHLTDNNDFGKFHVEKKCRRNICATHVFVGDYFLFCGGRFLLCG